MDTSGMHVFDWHRLFLGDVPPLFIFEIAFRTTVMYLYTLLAARLMGKRGMGPLTPFEFIIVIALGSATGDPMLYPAVPLVYGMTVLTVIVILERVIAELSLKSKFLADKIESTPTMVVQHGRIYKDALNKTKVSKEQLLMQLRMQGIKYLGEIEVAYLEPSGTISIFKYPKNLQKKSNNILPPKKEVIQ